MLPPINRLTKVRDFNLVMNHGSWVNGGLLSLKVLKLDKIKPYFPVKEDPNKFQKQLKFAFTIGLKVSKSAVVRNRIKRQLRETIRLRLKDKKIKEGYYILVVAKPIAVDKDYANLSEEMLLLLKKSNLSTD